MLAIARLVIYKSGGISADFCFWLYILANSWTISFSSDMYCSPIVMSQMSHKSILWYRKMLF